MSQVASIVVDDGKRAPVDPDGASSIDENGGALHSSPSALSPKSASSPRNYRIATDEGDDTVMTETEVSHLVNKALRRARKSTSPRKSPKTTSFDDSCAASTPLEPVAKSPQREREYVTLPQAPLSPCADFHDLLAPSNDSFSLAPKQSLDDSVAGSTSSKTHMTASDAIIRRVEEEIANARKAAEVASLRLTSALVSGSRESANIHDWRSSNDPRDWEQQDAAVITMRPSMDINDILNDHLADDEEFRVVLDNSFADDENSAYYRYTDNDSTARDEEFAAKTAAIIEQQRQQQYQDEASAKEEEGDKQGTEVNVSELTSDDLPDDEKKYHEGQSKEKEVVGRDITVDEATGKVDEVTETRLDSQQSNDDGTNEQAIETAATGEASLQSSSIGAPISATTNETTEDQVFQKNSTATSADVSFCGESYETAEEDLPFPMDSEKDTPKTDEETSPTSESKDGQEEDESQQIQVDKVPANEIDTSIDDKSHPAIGSEIFLSAQNMDAAVSQVGNDDASEYTEETISDEESAYTEVTIPEAPADAPTEKPDNESKSDQFEDNVLNRDIVVPTTESVNVPVPSPVVEKSPVPPQSPTKADQVPSQVTIKQPIAQEANTLPEIAVANPNDIMDKLESARKELDTPTKTPTPTKVAAPPAKIVAPPPAKVVPPPPPAKVVPPPPPVKVVPPPPPPVAAPTPVAAPVEPQPIAPKVAPRRVTLSVVTEPKRAKEMKEDRLKRSRVSFRAPYPPPPPFPRKRAPEEIIEEYREPIPETSSIWLRPKQELKQLLLAVTGTSLPRRSNACGALKVLSMKMKKNKLTLVKTDGFLSALVFAIREDIPIKDKDVALDARARAASTLLNVVEPKENRTIVFGYPGLPEALVKVITEDRGEARVHACQAMVMLAKTPACRELMPKVEGLIDVLAKVVQKTIDTDASGQVEEEKKDDSYDDEEAHPGSSSFSDDDGSTDHSDDEDSHTDGESSDASSAPRDAAASARLQSIRKKKNEQLAEFSAQARMSACAALSHLSKHCSISNQLCANHCLIECLINVSCEFDNSIHTKCIEMIANLTRFPANNEVMAQQPDLLEALVKCGKSKLLADRVWALRAFQNMSADPFSKVTLASGTILTLLSVCAVRRDYDERVPAVAALFNISTEPGAVVPLTNTRNVVATLVHLAHNSESTPEIRHMACDSLATIGLWLQTLAGTGTYPEGVKKVPLPSHATTGWQIWN